MINLKINYRNYDISVAIAKGIYWVGYHDVHLQLH